MTIVVRESSVTCASQEGDGMDGRCTNVSLLERRFKKAGMISWHS